MFRTLTAVGVVALVAAAPAQAQLTNPGFETAGGGTVFDGWGEFNNVVPNIEQSTEMVKSGSFGAKVFGTFAAAQNDTGINQAVPASPGQAWRATVSVAVNSGDPLGSAEIPLLILEFVDSGGTVISNVITQVADTTTTPDTWVEHSVAGLAPSGTTQARILLLHVQLGDTLNQGGASYWDDAVLEEIPGGTTLINGSFEQQIFDTSTTFESWAEQGNLLPNIQRVSEFPTVGAYNLKIFGQFTGFDNDSLVSQTHPAAPGETWVASIDTAQNIGDELGVGNVGYMNVRFLDAGGVELASTQTIVGLSGDTAGVATNYSSGAQVAPAGTASAQIQLGLHQVGFAVGALHFDDASFTKNAAEQILNGSFETLGGGTAAKVFGWTDIGQNIFTETLQPCDGDRHVKIFGGFTGAENDAFIYQDLIANPGATWEARVNTMQSVTDFLLGDNVAWMAIVFLDGSGTELLNQAVQVGDAITNPIGVCEFWTIGDTAPAGTETVRIMLGLTQPALAGGAIFFDVAELECLSGDCSVGPVGCTAFDITTQGAGSGDPGYGVPDGAITAADIQFYVNAYVAGTLAIADLTTQGAGSGDPGYGVPDGAVTAADIQYYVNGYVAGCP